jgi:hypothetical protein
MGNEKRVYELRKLKSLKKKTDWCYSQSKTLQCRPKRSKYVVRQLYKFLINTLRSYFCSARYGLFLIASLLLFFFNGIWIYLWKNYVGDEIKFLQIHIYIHTYINDFPILCYDEYQWEVERKRISYAVSDHQWIRCLFAAGLFTFFCSCVRLTYDILTFIFINSWNWYFK